MKLKYLAAVLQGGAVGLIIGANLFQKTPIFMAVKLGAGHNQVGGNGKDLIVRMCTRVLVAGNFKGGSYDGNLYGKERWFASLSE